MGSMEEVVDEEHSSYELVDRKFVIYDVTWAGLGDYVPEAYVEVPWKKFVVNMGHGKVSIVDVIGFRQYDIQVPNYPGNQWEKYGKEWKPKSWLWVKDALGRVCGSDHEVFEGYTLDLEVKDNVRELEDA